MKKGTRQYAILELIFDLGGQASREEINAKVPEYWTLTKADKTIEEGVGKPYFWHLSAGACSALKKSGFLINPTSCVWEITEKGEKLISMKNDEKIIQKDFYDIRKFLHPIIIEKCWDHFATNKYRNAVVDAITVVFDRVREKTGIDLDGEALASKIFSLQKPILIISNLTTESGKNEQIGFMEILKGAYKALRNPYAHTLKLSPDRNKCLQCLTFISMLANVIDSAHMPL